MRLKAIAAYSEWPPTPPTTLKDGRADPLAFSAIHASEKMEKPSDPLRTACIALLSSPWGSHYKKVLEASQEKRVRPGNFTRMGPHTVATYFATALGFHGPAWALLDESLESARDLVETLLQSELITDVYLILVEENRCTVALYDR